MERRGGIRVKVEGLRELERSLTQLSRAAARGALQRALRKGASPLVESAQAQAPVRTGGLRDSITASARWSGKGGEGKAAYAEAMAGGASKSEAGAASRAANKAARDGRDFAEIAVGPDRRPQAITQEFGTYFHPAQPFMRPAWDETQGAVLDRITGSLGSEISKAVARAAKAGKLKG